MTVRNKSKSGVQCFQVVSLGGSEIGRKIDRGDMNACVGKDSVGFRNEFLKRGNA